MEYEINAISHHVAASHKQACSDLEKASQFITEALQNEVQRNTTLCMLIHRLEERAAENGRSLSEQVESNRQLKLQVDELQKQLENKDNSLTQAKQSIAMLTNELTDLQQQMQSHQSSCRMIQEGLQQEGESQPNVVRIAVLTNDLADLEELLQSHQSNCSRTIQEVTEGLQEGESQPNVVKEEDGPLQDVDAGIKEEEDYAAVADGYQCSQYDETNSAPEQITSSSADIKSEPVQEEDEKSDMISVVSSDMAPVVSSDKAPVVSSDKAPVVSSDMAPVVSSDMAPVVNSDMAPVVSSDMTHVVSSASDKAPVVSSDMTPVVNSASDMTPVVSSDMAPVVSSESSDPAPVVSSTSDMAPVISSVMSQSLPDPPSLVKCRRLSVQVVDCCATQGQQRTQVHKSNKDGENPKTATGYLNSPLGITVIMLLYSTLLLLKRWIPKIKVYDCFVFLVQEQEEGPNLLCQLFLNLLPPQRPH
ncbi:MAP7 domain-containing protein 3-like [Engraulis encrasicolus]|uniref:MAP7 domain-containing protein 3-like n=1 Tax=Engraulis encrasicolus TaxID=184585 RepID=UPI002FD2A500